MTAFVVQGHILNVNDPPGYRHHEHARFISGFDSKDAWRPGWSVRSALNCIEHAFAVYFKSKYIFNKPLLQVM